MPNVTGFEITEVAGHTAAVVHTWAPGCAQDHRDMVVALLHGVYKNYWLTKLIRYSKAARQSAAKLFWSALPGSVNLLN